MYCPKENRIIPLKRSYGYEFPRSETWEIFAIAGLMMGANYIRVKCYAGVTRMGRIKGKIKKSGLDSRGRYPHRHSLEIPG